MNCVKIIDFDYCLIYAHQELKTSRHHETKGAIYKLIIPIPKRCALRGKSINDN